MRIRARYHHNRVVLDERFDAIDIRNIDHCSLLSFVLPQTVPGARARHRRARDCRGTSAMAAASNAMAYLANEYADLREALSWRMTPLLSAMRRCSAPHP